jgi:hypothetical protein
MKLPAGHGIRHFESSPVKSRENDSLRHRGWTTTKMDRGKKSSMRSGGGGGTGARARQGSGCRAGGGGGWAGRGKGIDPRGGEVDPYGLSCVSPIGSCCVVRVFNLVILLLTHRKFHCLISHISARGCSIWGPIEHQ